MSTKSSPQARLLTALIVLVISMVVSYPHIRDWHANRNAQSTPSLLSEAFRSGERAANNQKYEDADQAYQDALALIQEMRDAAPDDETLRKQEIEILDRLLGVAENRKDHAAASEWSGKALQSAEEHFKSRPTHTFYRNRLLQTALKAFEHSPRPFPGNVDVLKKSLELIAETDKDIRAIWLIRQGMADAWRRIARTYAEQKDGDAMAAAIREGIQWSRPTKHTQESRSDTLRMESAIIQSGRELAEKLGNVPLEDEFTLALIDVRSQQTRLDPFKVSFQNNLAALRHNMAKSYRDTAPDKAEELYELAVQDLKKAYDQQPGDVSIHKSYLRALNLRGRFFSDNKRNEEALKSYQTAYETAASLPEQMASKRLFYMGNYAILLMRTGRSKEARVVAQEAYDFAGSVSAKSPNSETARIDTAEAGLRLARYLKRRPNPQRKKALEIAQSQASILKYSPTAKPSQGELETKLKALIKELRRR